MHARDDFSSRSSTYIHPEPCKGWAMSPQLQTSFWRRKRPLCREAVLQDTDSWRRILALLPGLDCPHSPGVFWSTHRTRDSPKSTRSSVVGRSLITMKDRNESIPCCEPRWVRWTQVHACRGIPGVTYPQNSTDPSSRGSLRYWVQSDDSLRPWCWDQIRSGSPLMPPCLRFVAWVYTKLVEVCCLRAVIICQWSIDLNGQKYAPEMKLIWRWVSLFQSNEALNTCGQIAAFQSLPSVAVEKTHQRKEKISQPPFPHL